MAVRQKWPMMRLECHGFTRPATIMGSSRITEMTARKKAVCTLSTWVESRRIIALVEVKMKPPLTSHSAPCTLGGRRRSQSCIPIALDLVFAASPVGLAQGLLEHLADRATRQGGDEVDRLGRLHTAQLLLGERDELIRRNSDAGLQLDDRLHRLAPFVVGLADHRAILHGGLRAAAYPAGSPMILPFALRRMKWVEGGNPEGPEVAHGAGHHDKVVH